MAGMLRGECAEKTRNPAQGRAALAESAGLRPNRHMAFLWSWLKPLSRTRLSWRIFLAVFGTGLAVSLLVGAATRWNFNREFLGYLNDVAAGRMTYVGPDNRYYYCTGSLLNNTKRDYTPYFLSASHCISTQAAATSLRRTACCP